MNAGGDGLNATLKALEMVSNVFLHNSCIQGFTGAQQAFAEQSNATITQREQEINHISKSIFQLADIFKDLQTMVIDQGTLLDRIDFNVEQASVHLQDAVHELDEVITTLTIGMTFIFCARTCRLSN